MSDERWTVWREKMMAYEGIRRFLPPDFPAIVCLCGPTRFEDAYLKAQRDLAAVGMICLSAGSLGRGEGLDQKGALKAGLDELHLRKIDLCEEVLVLNAPAPVCAKCGKYAPPSRSVYTTSECCDAGVQERPYIGDSTRKEIAYAERMGKPIRYLNPPEGEVAP